MKLAAALALALALAVPAATPAAAHGDHPDRPGQDLNYRFTWLAPGQTHQGWRACTAHRARLTIYVSAAATPLNTGRLDLRLTRRGADIRIANTQSVLDQGYRAGTVRAGHCWRITATNNSRHRTLIGIVQTWRYF